ncbi:condensin-2 complex subunit D3-L-like isoform X2 [Ptychodera flava]|uniref:condensin-2 complex subunit D3-L-like isoform X2 n=1 Tax=Ptychodera flava TaxID=63121 RepID=UPI003969CB4E
MADPERTARALENLRLAELSQEFVENVWDSDFLEPEPLPPDLEQDIKENNYYVTHLHKVVSTFAPWVKSGRDSISQGFWNTLTDSGFSHRTLISLLNYFIQCPERCSAHQKQAAALSANVYFILTSIPGSVAYKVFHPVLFQKAVDVLKLWPQSSGGKRKRGHDPKPSSQGGNKRGKQARTDQDVEADDGVDFEMGSDDDNEDFELTPQDIIQIKNRLLALVKELIGLLKRFSLKDSDQATYHMIQVLVEMAKIDVELLEPDFDPGSDPTDVKCMSQLAYTALSTYCKQHHGAVQDTLVQVLVQLQPSLMMLMGENKDVAATTIPRHVQTVKDHAVSFVCYLIDDKGEAALRPTRTLLQNILWKVPDRAEYRSKVAEASVAILDKFPTEAYAKFLQWLVKCSKHSQTGHRMSSLETAAILLEKPARQADENITPELAACLSHHYLLQNIILLRCSDISAIVRSKALSCFAHCAASDEENMQHILRELFCSSPNTPAVTPASALRVQQIVTPESEQMVTPTNAQGLVTPAVCQGTTPNDQVTPGAAADTAETGVTAKTTLAMLRKRAHDEKTGVRKSAIQAIESIIKLDMTNISKEDIQVIRAKCQDAALSVRKQAMVSLTELLLAKPESNLLQNMWLDGVVPMVTDMETGCQEKCLDIMENVFLGNILPLERTVTPQNNMMWDILNKIAREGQEEYRCFVQKACRNWAKQGKLKPRLMNSLITHVNTDHGPGAWILLSMFAKHCPTIDQSFIHQCWEDFKSGSATITSTTLVHVVSVIGSTAKHLEKDIVEKFIRDFRNLLRKFTALPDVIQAVSDALCQLCSTLEDDNLTKSWCMELMSECDKYLSGVLLSENPDKIDEDKLTCYLFTLGVIIQLAPDKVPKRMKTLVLSILAGPKIAAHLKSSQQTQSSQQSQGTGCTQIPLSQLHNSNLSDRVQAFALITLGKLCLVDDSLAPQAIAPLAKELEESTSAAIRNNAVVIMSDLCVRYPGLVDRYIPNVTACVKDESAMVRKQTLTVITRLLQEEYIKWKGVLFFRFISALVDDVEDIRQLAEFSLSSLFGKRHPLMFFNHFVECVFHFNDFNSHKVYNKFSQTDRERKLFSLKGKQNFAKRMKMYKFMLENMNDDQRFNLTAKLCKEILSGVADNVMAYDEDSQDLLRDALAVLSCKEIKLKSLKARSGDDIEDEPMDIAGAAVKKVKTTFITHVVRKNVIENIVPIIISLKQMLEKHRSPLLRDLMLYLAAVMKEFKNEVKDILAADRQLAIEIEFDLRKFEEEQKERERKEKEKKMPRPRQSIISSRMASPRTPNVCTPHGRSKVNTPNSAPIPPLCTPVNMRRTSILAASAKKVIEEVTKRRSRSLSDIHNTSQHRSILEPTRTPLAASAKPTRQTPSTAPRRNIGPGQDAQRSKSVSDAIVEKTTPVKRVTIHPDIRSPAIQMNSNSGKANRAISTPDKSIANITFYNDTSNTVPPSPIPTSLPIRLCSDANPRDFPGTASFLPRLESDEDSGQGGGQKRDLICMFSPEHPIPRPRTWRVTPKASKVLTESNTATSRGSPRPGTSREPDSPIEKRQTRSNHGGKLKNTRSGNRNQKR